MSQTCDYFMNYDGSLAELADIARFAIGVNLSACHETSGNLCELSMHWQVIATRLPARFLTSDAELSIIDYLERTDSNDGIA